jgi:hypothetical protein
VYGSKDPDPYQNVTDPEHANKKHEDGFFKRKSRLTYKETDPKLKNLGIPFINIWWPMPLFFIYYFTDWY